MSDKARYGNQKLKLLYLYKILFEMTDENHPLTMPELIAQLESYGITAERKTLYDDINALRAFGVDIISGRGSNSGYRLVNREFQLAELNLLANAVSSSKFLTEKKSKELLTKISTLTSRNEAQQLQREVYMANRPKAVNERIYYNVDTIYRALAAKKKIAFRLFDYDMHKKIVYREGIRFCSPYAMAWNEERYYLLAYYDKYDGISHFRVDRMEQVQIVDEPVEKPPEDFSVPEYLSSSFSMFSGDAEDVRLRFDKSLVNPVLDRFGQGVSIYPHDEEHFDIVVKIKTEHPQPFFAWLFKFGNLVRIIEPVHLREKYLAELKAAAECIEENDRY